jgi:hypothetical protein
MRTRTDWLIALAIGWPITMGIPVAIAICLAGLH